MAQTWDNNDGLRINYGIAKTVNATAGEYRNSGPKHIIEVVIDWTKLPAVASNSVIADYTYVLPTGSVVESVELTPKTDFTSAGSAMTLNVGWVDLDGTSNVDVDAFVVAATQTELNTGGTNIAGWVGAEVLGNPTTTAKYITWEVDTAAATAGFAVLRIYYTRP